MQELVCGRQERGCADPRQVDSDAKGDLKSELRRGFESVARIGGQRAAPLGPARCSDACWYPLVKVDENS